MWLRKIKYKKLQYILMMIILAAASMIFFASLAYTREVNAAVEKFYSESNTPDIIFTTQGGTYEQLTNDEVMKEIDEAYFYEGRSFDEIIKLNGTAHRTGAKIFPLESVNDFKFKMKIKESIGGAACPKRGEVWLSYTYAEESGIKMGDTLTLGSKGDFKVSGYVISPATASPFFAYYPYFVNTDDYGDFSDSNAHELVLVNNSGRVSSDNELLYKIIDIIGDKTQSGIGTAGLRSDDTMTVNISGNIGIAASLIMFAAALFVIAYIVRSNLQKELKNIGIYKSLGVSNNKIRSIYFAGYLVTSAIAALIGILVGLPVICAMCAPAVKNFTLFTLSGVSIVCGVISVLLLTVLTAVTLLVVLVRINKVRPVETINMGLRSSAKKLKKSVIKSARSPLSMAVNEIFKFRASSVMAVLMIALSVFMAFTFGSTGYGMSFMNKKTGVYGGMPDGDAYIMNANSLFEQVAERSDTKSVIAYERKFLKLSINGEFLSFNVDILNNFSPEVSGLAYLQGREPRTKDETAIHADLLQNLKLKVNDYVEICVEGKTPQSYLITGSFGLMLGSTNTIQFLSDSAIKADAAESSGFEMLCIKFNKGVDFDDFKQQMNDGYGVLALENHPVFKQMADMIYGIVKTPVNIMIAIFMGFSVLIIINLLFMNYMDNKKSFGTLKTLGLTTKYITLKNLFKTLILAGVGLALGWLLGFLIAPHIYGWATFTSAAAFEYSISLPLIIAGALISLVTLITLFFAIPIEKIKPTILMEE